MLKNVNVGTLNAENCFGEVVEVSRTVFGAKMVDREQLGSI